MHVGTANVGDGPFEAPIIGHVPLAATEMPFADEAGAVAGLLQQLGQDGGVAMQMLAGLLGVGDVVAEFVHSGQQRGARR